MKFNQASLAAGLTFASGVSARAILPSSDFVYFNNVTTSVIDRIHNITGNLNSTGLRNEAVNDTTVVGAGAVINQVIAGVMNHTHVQQTKPTTKPITIQPIVTEPTVKPTVKPVVKPFLGPIVAPGVGPLVGPVKPTIAEPHPSDSQFLLLSKVVAGDVQPLSFCGPWNAEQYDKMLSFLQQDPEVKAQDLRSQDLKHQIIEEKRNFCSKYAHALASLQANVEAMRMTASKAIAMVVGDFTKLMEKN